MAGWLSGLNLESITAQVNGLTQSIGEGASKIGNEIQEKVNTFATFELESIEKAIQDIDNGIVGEGMKTKQEDVSLKRTSVKILPWETRLEHKAILSQALMERVLALSLEESNFTTSPSTISIFATGATGARGGDGSQEKREEDENRHSSGTGTGKGTETPFQLKRHIDVAMKMLSLDPNLAKIHARLISNVPESIFWRNYFLRIAELREEIGFEPLCEDQAQEGSTALGEDFDKVSHGDTQSMQSPSAPRERAVEDVDKADADDDYSDLGDLDDLDGDSDTNIDDALEAEIAAELREG